MTGPLERLGLEFEKTGEEMQRLQTLTLGWGETQLGGDAGMLPAHTAPFV